MSQQIIENETEQDMEHKKAVREFYRVYNALRKKRALSMHGHAGPKGALIEIWEYKNSGEKKTLCRVRAENDTDCHRIAAEQLKWELEKTRGIS